MADAKFLPKFTILSPNSAVSSLQMLTWRTWPSRPRRRRQAGAQWKERSSERGNVAFADRCPAWDQPETLLTRAAAMHERVSVFPTADREERKLSVNRWKRRQAMGPRRPSEGALRNLHEEI